MAVTDKKKVLVSSDFFRGKKEVYCHFIECPKCKELNTAFSNFCSNCGVEFKLTTELKRLIEQWH